MCRQSSNSRADAKLCECMIPRTRCRLHADDVKAVIARQMLYNSKRNDKTHSRDNDLTLHYLISMFKGRDDHVCPYCNQLMDLLPTRLSKGKTLTLQRKINRIGHVKDNVIFCCFDCNRGRAEKRIHLCVGEGCTSVVDSFATRCDNHQISVST